MPFLAFKNTTFRVEAERWWWRTKSHWVSDFWVDIWNLLLSLIPFNTRTLLGSYVLQLYARRNLQQFLQRFPQRVFCYFLGGGFLVMISTDSSTTDSFTVVLDGFFIGFPHGSFCALYLVLRWCLRQLCFRLLLSGEFFYVSLQFLRRFLLLRLRRLFLYDEIDSCLSYVYVNSWFLDSNSPFISSPTVSMTISVLQIGTRRFFRVFLDELRVCPRRLVRYIH